MGQKRISWDQIRCSLTSAKTIAYSPMPKSFNFALFHFPERNLGVGGFVGLTVSFCAFKNQFLQMIPPGSVE